jgi:ATP-binding cassette subfamily C (CFTR/MRP) protein 1
LLHKPDIRRDALSSVANNQTGSNIWLKHWSETNNDVGENPQVAKFIGVYVVFGLGSAVLVFIQSMILWLACSIKVRRAPMVFETLT